MVPQVDEYAKYISVWNPDSITSTIRSLKGKGVSTGVSQEFNALYGTFRAAPSLTGNLETTLEGDMGVDFFGYQGGGRSVSAVGTGCHITSRTRVGLTYRVTILDCYNSSSC